MKTKSSEAMDPGSRRRAWLGRRGLGVLLAFGSALLACAQPPVSSGVSVSASEPETAGVPRTPSEPEAVTHDGLERVKSRRLDAVYRLPGASLAAYHRILLDPVQVSFARRWTADPSRVTAKQRERIRARVAEQFRKTFVEELEKKGGYPVTDAPAPDVLRLTAQIINLYVTAPDPGGRDDTYVVSAGEMTLVAEMRDSETGAILARAADRRASLRSGSFQLASRGMNTAEARRIFRAWADVLRDALDASRSEQPE